jgi:hypothetical protein
MELLATILAELHDTVVEIARTVEEAHERE